MTDQRDKATEAPAAGAVESSPPALVSRRMLLRGASAAVPTIMTLNSASAMAAVSSNLISASNTADGNKYICLSSEALVDGPYANGKYDLGANPSIVDDITIIPSGNTYYVEQNASGTPVQPLDMCSDIRKPSTYYYQDRGWQTLQVKKGIVVSCRAVSSFGAGSTCQNL